jgi:hypothetical protein
MHHEEILPKFKGFAWEYEILKDQQTGILYSLFNCGNGGVAMTPLLDADGKPLVVVDKSE